VGFDRGNLSARPTAVLDQSTGVRLSVWGLDDAQPSIGFPLRVHHAYRGFSHRAVPSVRVRVVLSGIVVPSVQRQEEQCAPRSRGLVPLRKGPAGGGHVALHPVFLLVSHGGGPLRFLHHRPIAGAVCASYFVVVPRVLQLLPFLPTWTVLV